MLTNSIYIHIPFCDNLCSYCDFTKVLNYEKFTDKYLDSLEYEIRNKYQGDNIKTLYVGGGTPSTLSLLQLKKLFNIINIFNLDPSCEITFEMNVESTTKSKLDFLYQNGVNRLSFGVQTFNDEILKKINRFHNQSEVINVIEKAKQIGFTNINIDLMFNLPTQTKQDLEYDLNEFLKLNVTHLSIYSLILEEKSVYGSKKIEIDYGNFDNWYYMIKDFLEEKNFIHYETSNFARAGFESKHNLVYWNTDHYYGFGLGASSYIDNARSENTASITKYLKNDFEAEINKLSKLDLMQEFMFLGLRKLEGIKIEEFNNKFNEDLFKVFDLSQIDSELIIVEDGTIRLSRVGLVRANDVLVSFV